MHSIESMVTDLEWERLRWRVSGHPRDLLARCGAWALIRLLKLIDRGRFFRAA